MRYDDDWLRSRLDYWQEILRLTDWRIAAEWAHLRDVPDEPSSMPNARVRCDIRRRHAQVWMVFPDEMAFGTDAIQALDPLDMDPEVILVHELLHVSLWEMDYAVPESIDHSGSAYEIGQERHIMILASALVTLDRRRNPLANT